MLRIAFGNIFNWSAIICRCERDAVKSKNRMNFRKYVRNTQVQYMKNEYQESIFPTPEQQKVLDNYG